MPETSIADWLKVHAPDGGRIGYDPWLHTKDWVKKAREALADKGAELVAVRRNPIDAVWADQPEPSRARLIVHPDAYAGKSSAAKRQEMADWLKEQKADAAVLAALDSIAWTFNVRGQDVEHTPVALSFALVHDDGTADLFVASEKIGDDVRQHLGNGVRVHERARFRAARWRRSPARPSPSIPSARSPRSSRRWRRPAPRSSRSATPRSCPRRSRTRSRSPATAPPRRATAPRLSRFLHWLSVEAPKGGVDELKAAAKLQAFRQQSGDLRDLSFDTISGAGPNGAIVHYRVSEATNRPLEMDSIYLVDSGGQYPDGTTDVTRTVAIGTPTRRDEGPLHPRAQGPYRGRPRALPGGHARLASSTASPGSSSGRPGSITPTAPATASAPSSRSTKGRSASRRSAAPRPAATSRCKAGMILSNEPGYYKTGEYGIRVENLVLVVPVEVEGAEKKLLGFETLTFAPIDRNLIETAMLVAGRAALGRRLSRRGAADRRPAARRRGARPGSKRPARRSKPPRDREGYRARRVEGA